MKNLKYKYKLATASLALMTILCLSRSRLQAQGFYIRAGGGYSIQASSSQYNNADPNGLTVPPDQDKVPSIRVTIDGQGNQKIESLKGTLGEGFKLGAVAGYMFNPYIGTELGVYYFHGSEQTIGEFNASPFGFNSKEVAYIRGVDIAPALVLTPGFESINPYVRVGLLIPVAGDLTIETSVAQSNYQNSGQDLMVKAEAEVQPKFSVGYHGAIGVSVPLNDMINLFVETEFKSISLKSDEAEITSFETMLGGNPVPGQQLDDLPTSEKKFIFSDEFTVSDDENQPRTLPTQYVNASGLGLNLGLIFTF